MKYETQIFIKRIIKYLPFFYVYKRKLLSDFSLKYLKKSLTEAVRNVPYYNKYIDRLNSISLNDFPVLRKRDIMGHEEEFISKKCLKCFMHKVKTGGSTGQSLQLYYSIKTLIKKDVVSDYAFSLIGENLNVAILRGNKPKNGEYYEVVAKKTILLSSYLLSDNMLDDYLSLLKSRKIECIHAYPSSLSILARLIKKRYNTADIPTLKGILTSSEIFSREDKALVREVFPNVKIIDYYSHNELACCALSIDEGYYKFFNNYGYVEFIETGEVLSNGNRIAEIVATSIMNSGMPFIRYGTDDFVELDSGGNVVSIIGRASDFVVNAGNEVVPCIIHTRYESKKNVIAFQFYQEKVGELIYRVVVNKSFSNYEAEMLEEDLKNCFKGMVCKVVVVDQIEKTRAGKQMRLIQKLNVRNYL